MTGKVDPCLRVHVLSASALPRSRGGSEPSSWFVEAKVGTSNSRWTAGVHKCMRQLLKADHALHKTAHHSRVLANFK